MPFSNGGRVVAFIVISGPQSELRVKKLRVLFENPLQLGDSVVRLALREVEHRIVKLFLERITHLRKMTRAIEVFNSVFSKEIQ